MPNRRIQSFLLPKRLWGFEDKNVTHVTDKEIEDFEKLEEISEYMCIDRRLQKRCILYNLTNLQPTQTHMLSNKCIWRESRIKLSRVGVASHSPLPRSTHTDPRAWVWGPLGNLRRWLSSPTRGQGPWAPWAGGRGGGGPLTHLTHVMARGMAKWGSGATYNSSPLTSFFSRTQPRFLEREKM